MHLLHNRLILHNPISKRLAYITLIRTVTMSMLMTNRKKCILMTTNRRITTPMTKKTITTQTINLRSLLKKNKTLINTQKLKVQQK